MYELFPVDIYNMSTLVVPFHSVGNTNNTVFHQMSLFNL